MVPPPFHMLLLLGILCAILISQRQCRELLKLEIAYQNKIMVIQLFNEQHSLIARFARKTDKIDRTMYALNVLEVPFKPEMT